MIDCGGVKGSALGTVRGLQTPVGVENTATRRQSRSSATVAEFWNPTGSGSSMATLSSRTNGSPPIPFDDDPER
jgi:hypothetical protein